MLLNGGRGQVSGQGLSLRFGVRDGDGGRGWVSGRGSGLRSSFWTGSRLGFWMWVGVRIWDGGVGVGFQGMGRGSRSGFRSSEGVGFWDGRRRVSGSGLGFRVRVGSDFRTASGSRLGFEVEVGFRNEGGGRGRVFKWGWGQGWVLPSGSIFEMGIDIGSVSG
ncbi:hypothetical protein TIFTF001_053023 [Ficus carica]|uniref:Uncharacterized protein n=1 Tax=Ficus carica TaxID=3494 RepID=A0AA88EEL3_FICCA|nr:hypothetical protein TIFTF001_053023 [Ficus carica]